MLNPDEVLTLGRHIAILLNPSARPHYLRPVDYWDIPAAFEDTLKEKYPHLYWDPPLAYDRNPYIPARKAR